MAALTILIADDEPDMRLYLRSCLRGMGPGVGRLLEAADGLQALALVRSGVVDVVICDVLMPGLGGHGLRRAIREDPLLRDLPMLLISGEQRNASSGPVDAFLAKPFNAAQLETALVALLGSWSRAPPLPDPGA